MVAMENPNYVLEGVLKDNSEYQVFEGPLSLILMLLSKNKIEIRDIKIAEILDQYLAYLERMQQMDMEIASEFVQMASYLLYLKTKMLLSGDKKVPDELEVLIASLEQLQARDRFAAIKNVLGQLRSASETGKLFYIKPQESRQRIIQPYEYRHSGEELLQAAMSALKGSSAAEQQNLSFVQSIPHRIVYSVREKSRDILNLLATGEQAFHQLYQRCASRSEVVATFVSVLELCSMGSVMITERDGVLYLSYSGGDMEEILDKIEE